MKMIRKAAAILSMVLLSMTFVAGPGTAMAVAEEPAAPGIVAQIDQEDFSMIYLEPRYKNISTISAGLSISSLGRAACTSSVTLRNDYSGTLTMTLEQLNSKDRWVEITSWSTEFSGSGVVQLDKGYYVDKGYNYQVITHVEVRDGDETIETAGHYSPMKFY